MVLFGRFEAPDSHFVSLSVLMNIIRPAALALEPDFESLGQGLARLFGPEVAVDLVVGR